jgi:hypothetical protein
MKDENIIQSNIVIKMSKIIHPVYNDRVKLL